MDKLPLTSRKWTPEQAREFFKKKRSFSENNVIDDDSFDLVEVLNNLKYESGEMKFERKKRGRRNSSPGEFRYEEPPEVVEDNDMDICSGNLSAFSLLVDFGQILRTKEKDPNEIEIEDAERSPSPMSPEQPSTPPATTPPVVFENQIPITKLESSVRIIPQMPPLQQQQVPHQIRTHQVPVQHVQVPQHQQTPPHQMPPLQFPQKHMHQVPQQQIRTHQVQVQQVQIQLQDQLQMQLQDQQVLSPQQQAQQQKKRKNRRKHTEIQRTFICPLTGCGKAYGSEGACKTHVRIKHQDIFSVQQQSINILTQFPLTQLN